MIFSFLLQFSSISHKLSEPETVYRYSIYSMPISFNPFNVYDGQSEASQMSRICHQKQTFFVLVTSTGEHLNAGSAFNVRNNWIFDHLEKDYGDICFVKELMFCKLSSVLMNLILFDFLIVSMAYFFRFFSIVQIKKISQKRCCFENECNEFLEYTELMMTCSNRVFGM